MADAAWLSMGGTPSPSAWEAAEASPRGDKCSSGASAASTTQSKTNSTAATLPTRIAGSNQPVTQASAPLSTRHPVHVPPQRYLRPPKWRGFLLEDTFSACFTTTLAMRTGLEFWHASAVPTPTPRCRCPVHVQDMLANMIKAPGVAQREVSELFAFTIPTVPGGSLYDASGLEMTDRQKDIMAALSGCCDVAGLLRRVKPKVRPCARQHAAITDLR